MNLADILLSGINMEKNALALVLNARRFSGKTFLIKELLNSKKFKDVYDEIYVFSDTGYLDETWKQVKNKEMFIIDKYEEDKFNEFVKDIKKENKDRKKKKKILVIIDDLIEIYSTKRNNPIALLATRGRHFGISFILTTQKYNRVPPEIRSNTTSKVFFKISNGREMKSIVDDTSSRKFSMEELIDNCTENPYQYFLVKNGETNEYYSGCGLEIEKVDLN